MTLTAGQSGFFDTVRGGGAVYCAAVHTTVLFGFTFPVWLVPLNVAWLHGFLVLSGFFIHRGLARADLAGFVQSRALRLLPPFILAVALTVALWTIAPLFFASGTREFLTPTARSGIALTYLPSTLMLVNGLVGGTLNANGPLWTLAFEVWLYAMVVGCAAGGRWRLLARLTIPLICLRNPAFVTYGLAWAAGWVWSVLHARGRLSVPSCRFAPFERAAPFSYALYITHFPSLLYLYGAWGERPWTAPFAFVLVVALAAVFGPAFERSGPAFLVRYQAWTRDVAAPPANASAANRVTRTLSLAVGWAKARRPAGTP